MTPAPVVTTTAGQWPWKATEANPGAWVQVSAEHWWYCLEVLPPIYFNGGFAVSEPLRDGATGAPVYLCLTAINGRRFARELTLREAEAAVRELRDHLPPRMTPCRWRRLQGFVRATFRLDAQRAEAAAVPIPEWSVPGLDAAKRHARWAWERLPLDLRRQLQDPTSDQPTPGELYIRHIDRRQRPECYR